MTLCKFDRMTERLECEAGSWVKEFHSGKWAPCGDAPTAVLLAAR